MPTQYPGVNDTSVYSEGLNVGYRWYDANNIAPAYPFGHGLSYTTFKYSDIFVDGRNIKAKITNTGKMAGKEVA